jgi:hypothetical protein
LGDPVLVPRLAALRVLSTGDPKEHEREDALLGDLPSFLPEGLQRVLMVARHRSDRGRLADPFLHEERSNEVTRPEVGLRNQEAKRLCPAEPSGPVLRERQVLNTPSRSRILLESYGLRT